MKRHSVVLVGSLVMAGALVAAQGGQTPPQNPPEQKRPAPIEITLTGCLIQGSSPEVFILDNATAASADRADTAARYILAEWADFNVKAHLNHEVTITGSADSKVAAMPKPGQKSDDKDLPKLTAKSVTMISDKCTAAPSR